MYITEVRGGGCIPLVICRCGRVPPYSLKKQLRTLLTICVQICTMLYMEYKLADFRKKTKEAFDYAMRGRDVFIIRNSMKFRLYLEEVTFSEKNGFPVLKVRDKSTTEKEAIKVIPQAKKMIETLTEPKIIKTPKQAKKLARPPLCPHGLPWMLCKVGSCNIKGRNMGL